MKKSLTLTKEQIKSIKYFILCEQKQFFGNWSKFEIVHLKVHSNGDYYFKLHWKYRAPSQISSYNNDRRYEGNLFKEFPIYSVIDGLDCAKLMFCKIHMIAYERENEIYEYSSKQFHEEIKYYLDIYKEGGCYNEEGKDIKNILGIE